MKLIDKVLDIIGFKKIIKIEGKNDFDQLNEYEVGLLIDSFLEDDSEYFDKLAFNEFLHWDIKKENLLKIQNNLNENTFTACEGANWLTVNEAFLRNLSKKLKKK